MSRHIDLTGARGTCAVGIRAQATSKKSLSPFVVAVVPGVLLALALTALVVITPSLAARVVTEDGPVEWLQVTFALLALGCVARSAMQRFSPANLLGGALLIEFVIAEIDLDRRVFGLAVIDWRFFRNVMIPAPLRVVVAAVIASIVVAFVLYACVKWRALWSEARAGFREGWAWLLLGGIVLFAIPQPCESCMHRLLPLPRYFLEESLELLGMLYVVLAMAARARSTRP